jgi:hypothetical protein
MPHGALAASGLQGAEGCGVRLIAKGWKLFGSTNPIRLRGRQRVRPVADSSCGKLRRFSIMPERFHG